MNLYIHIPFCAAKCHYCALYSVVAAQPDWGSYLTLLWRELELSQQLCLRQFKTVYVGGGTPSLLGAEGVAALAAGLRERGLLQGVTEWSMELNPASCSRLLLDKLREVGVTRLSFGAQSYNDATLRRIGRQHDSAAIGRALTLAQAAGFDNFGIDLIAALPGESAADWEATLSRAIASGCRHLSVYGLMIEPGTRLQHTLERGLFRPDDEAELDSLALAEERLVAAGFERYEISNYALPGYRCQHNLNVWQGDDYLGLGPGAASRVGVQRWHTLADLQAWQRALRDGLLPPRDNDERVTAEEDAIERTLYSLRLLEGMAPLELVQRSASLAERAQEWRRQLRQLQKHGIVEQAEVKGQERWRLTARGREVADSVMELLV